MTDCRTGSDCSGSVVVDVLRSALAGAPLGAVESVVRLPVRVVVYGQPAPQGSKRHVGGGRMIESSKAVKPWREAVKYAARLVIEREGIKAPLDGPLLARVVVTVPKPKSAPKRRRTWPDRKPDLSKLLRSTEDALTDAGLIADDARLVEFSRLAKVFPGEDPEALESPGCVITVEPVKA